SAISIRPQRQQRSFIVSHSSSCLTNLRKNKRNTILRYPYLLSNSVRGNNVTAPSRVLKPIMMRLKRTIHLNNCENIFHRFKFDINPRIIEERYK
ncbi:hypothetical protein CRM22_008584, partial [Opisthorchis felineus]